MSETLARRIQSSPSSKGHRRPLTTTTALALAALCLLAVTPRSAAADDKNKSFIGIGVNVFFDDGSLEGEEAILNPNPNDESYEYSSEGLLALSTWAMFPVWGDLYLGGQLSYFFEYETSAGTEDSNTCSGNDSNNVCVLGHLIEFLGRTEYVYGILADLDLFGGAVFGLSMLVPSGQFEDEIERLQNQNVDVLGPGVPRIGYVVGPAVGTRWQFHSLMSLRGEFVLKWEQLFLFNTEQTVSGIPFRKEWTTKTLRYEFNAGLEVAF